MTQKWTHCYQLKPGRWVFAPTDEARTTGSRIKREVAARWSPPRFFFHLRAGGHVAAVHSHTVSKFFFRADVEDFFGRVSRSRVTRCLKAWFPYADAREMASESVVKRPDIDGFVLPYGFVQSPILASLALDKSKLGSYLRKLSTRNDLKISVYVDDIIISSDDNNVLQKTAERFNTMADASLFPINTAKQEGPALQTTAFNIVVAHKSLKITDARLAEFRRSYKSTASAYSRLGIRSYVESVNPSQAEDLKR